MNYYCSLARSPVVPLLSRVSRRPNCSKSSRSFSSPSLSALENCNGFNPSSGSSSETLECLHQVSLEPIALSNKFHLKTLRNDSGLKPRSSSCGFHQRSTISPGGFRLKTLGNSYSLKSRTFSIGFLQRTLENSTIVTSKNILMGARVFSSGSSQRTLENVGRERGSRPLPWIAAYRDKEGKGVEKRTAVRTNRSSWEESADSYFSRKGRNPLKENRERDRSVESEDNRRNIYAKEDEGEEEVAEEGEVAEPVDDPRWNRIKSKYKGFIDRESRFEKPELQRWNKQENWGRNTWKEATESSIPKMVGQGIYGVGPVLAALTVERREFYALYIQEGLDLSGNNRKKKDKKGVEKVLKLAEKIGLKVIETSKHDLNMVVDNRPHQGLVLDASPLEMVNIRELEPASMEGQRAPVWVALDEVTDPQNLGAIVRSAYFFGVEGVVLCAKNSAPLSGVVSKASAGSLELIELRSCKNMMQFLSSSIENGWRVLGGSVSSRALPLSEVEAGVPTILVLGSEGSGLRPLVERSCTQLIRIPGNVSMDECEEGTELEAEEIVQSRSGQELKSFLAVESLNVSVAAGVLLYHLVGNNCHLVGETPETTFE